MGNCLVLQDKVIRVIKTDGEVLEYKTPMKIYELLSEFPGHAISETLLHGVQDLKPDSDMFGGHWYYLLPLPTELRNKILQYSIPAVKRSREPPPVVRIKVVISRQKLEEMFRRGVSFDDMISQLQKKRGNDEFHKFDQDGDGNGYIKGWKPVLESIPEAN